MVQITTLSANNEFSASATASVNAIILENRDEVIRPITTNLDTWNTVRISFKFAVVGSATSGDLSGSALFIGLCSETRSYGSASQQHCAGMQIGGFGVATGSDGTTIGGIWNAFADTNTSPTNETVWFRPTCTPIIIVTGSYAAGGGNTQTVSRYETLWNPAYASSSIMGWPWTPWVIEMCRNSTNASVGNMGVTYTSYGNPSNGSIGVVNGINVPKNVFTICTQFVKTDNGSVLGPVSNWFTEMKSSWTVGNYTFAQLSKLRINEEVYGPLNWFNMYWRCATPGVKIAIRDIIITKID